MLAMRVPAVQVSENLIFYPLVPPEAGQGWKLELFTLSETIPPHYHKLQRQFILVVDGELKAICSNASYITMQSSEFILIEPGVVHSLVPNGSAQFFAIDLPGFVYPEDVFYDKPSAIPKWKAADVPLLPELDPHYFGSRIDAGNYAVYSLVSPSEASGKWSAALLEIHDSPRHFHHIEKEFFLVMNGELDIEMDGVHRTLSVGESVMVTPSHIHKLTSAREEPVRASALAFPHLILLICIAWESEP